MEIFGKTVIPHCLKKGNKMSVGIFMPCFNVAPYIEESLESIFKQTYKDWEIVVLDDCSSDSTWKTLQNIYNWRVSYLPHGEFAIYKRDNHSGRIGQVKNEAILKFKKEHEYICHVGSDDRIPDYCLQTFVDYMDKNPSIGACCGNFICFDDKGKQWTFPHVANSGEYDSNILLRYHNFFPMRFYRKSIIDKVGGYSNEIKSAVDYDLALKIDEITKIHRIKEPITYYYRQHSQQISTRARPEQDANAKKALKSALKRRNINGIVENNKMPFKIKYIEEEHFIWGGSSE
jgi:glycosyltransferase involved in cell wall biosynthesis